MSVYEHQGSFEQKLMVLSYIDKDGKPSAQSDRKTTIHLGVIRDFQSEYF